MYYLSHVRKLKYYAGIGVYWRYRRNVRVSYARRLQSKHCKIEILLVYKLVYICAFEWQNKGQEAITERARCKNTCFSNECVFEPDDTGALITSHYHYLIGGQIALVQRLLQPALQLKSTRPFLCSFCQILLKSCQSVVSKSQGTFISFGTLWRCNSLMYYINLLLMGGILQFVTGV